MSDLLPCPFCGGEVQLMSGTGPFAPCVMCECGCDLNAGSDEESIAAWNTRADRWHRIDDKDNPPPDGQDILVSVTHSVGLGDDGQTEWQTVNWVDFLIGDKWANFPHMVWVPFPPTHWRPLPAPPTEGEG